MNFYAAPRTEIGPEPAGTTTVSRAEALRRTYLAHETSVRSIGSMCFILGILGLLPATVAVWEVVRGPSGKVENSVLGLLAIGFVFALGEGLTRLRPWARWTASALAGFSMLAIVVIAFGLAARGRFSTASTLIGAVSLGIVPGLVLLLMLAPAGTLVFSREYKALIARTRHVDLKSAWEFAGRGRLPPL